MTDMENWWLARFNTSTYGVPQGLERLTNEHWVNFVKADLPKSDFTWEQYEYHVRNHFGDEWFFDQDRPPGPEWGEEDRPPGKRQCLKDAKSLRNVLGNGQHWARFVRQMLGGR